MNTLIRALLAASFAVTATTGTSHAESIQCSFASRSVAIPKQMTLDIQPQTKQAIIRDDFQKRIEHPLVNVELERETTTRDLYKWTIDNVPGPVRVELGRRDYDRSFLYSIWIDKRRTKATLNLVVPTGATAADPLSIRASGKCKRLPS